MPRLLCLHGYTQNATLFRQRTAVLRKQLEPNIECVYVDAPFLCPGEPEEKQPRTWWILKTDGQKFFYDGYQQSLTLLNDLWKTGGFVGVLGFSQGAVMAQIFANQAPSPCFLISVSGFPPRDESIRLSLTKTPSLHVIGTSDEIIDPAFSLASAQQTAGEAIGLNETVALTTVLSHPGGHVVPGQAPFRKAMAAWIEQQSVQSKI